jgi:hypothetical protein
VLASTGGTLRHTYVVLRVVGEPRETYAGPAVDAVACFSLALEVDAEGRTVPEHTGAIAWLVHHPDERVGRVEVDFERVARVAAGAQPMASAPAVPVPSPAPASAPALPPAAVLVDPGPVDLPAAHVRAVSAGAVDVLPAGAKAPGRRGLFGRRG